MMTVMAGRIHGVSLPQGNDPVISVRGGILAYIAVTAMPAIVSAQMFGARQIGEPLTRGGNVGMFTNAGQLNGSARYMRGNRKRDAFVGTDLGDQPKFVGSVQARTGGVVLPAVTTLTPPPDQSKQLNQPLPKPGDKAIYSPVLRLNWTPPARPATELTASLERALSNSRRFSSESRLVVSVEGRTAVLRGEVFSVAERDLAENVLRLEPGVSTVRNELQVMQGPTIPAPPLPDPELSPHGPAGLK